MVEAILALPAHIRGRLALALETGALEMSASPASLSSVLGGGGDAAQAGEALAALRRLGLSGSAAATFVRGVGEAASRVVRPDMVWSGPEVAGLHARDTRRVYEEFLTSAKRTVLACTYAFFDGPKAFELLAERMVSVAGLKVTLLLNIERKRGDTSAPDQLVRRFADRFWRTDWPGSVRPSVYYDPRSLELDGPAGVLHAKSLVVDDETVLVTSANMTEAALDRNIELGLLVHDPALAASVTRHFQGLIDCRMLVPLPAS